MCHYEGIDHSHLSGHLLYQTAEFTGLIYFIHNEGDSAAARRAGADQATLQLSAVQTLGQSGGPLRGHQQPPGTGQSEASIEVT